MNLILQIDYFTSNRRKSRDQKPHRSLSRHRSKDYHNKRRRSRSKKRFNHSKDGFMPREEPFKRCSCGRELHLAPQNGEMRYVSLSVVVYSNAKSICSILKEEN